MTLDTIGQPTRVDVQAIEKELLQLWKSAGEPTPGAQPVTRTLTLNLIGIAPDAEAANRMTNTVVALTSSHPNRTILITADPGAPEPRLEAWVQANCRLVGPGLPQVCGEQVSLAAYGAAVSQVPSLVFSLLVPDLPVVLWWPGRAPFGSAYFQRLNTFADRMIVDSAGFASPDRDLLHMAELSVLGQELHIWSAAGSALAPGAGRPAPIISDLSWARLTPWRELTAQFFDARPLLAHLYRLDKVVIDYQRDPRYPPNRTQALLLAGWLASRLGWTPLEEGVSVEGELVRLHLRRAAPTVGRSAIRLVTVELHPVPALDDEADTIAALRLMALDNILATFTVELTSDPHCARTTAEVASQPTITRLARIERRSEDEVLAGELRLLSRDRSFAEALRMAGVFARHL